VAVHAGWRLLFGFCLWGDVHWSIETTWSKGDLEDLDAAKGSLLLLVGDAQEVLDRGTTVSSWPSGLQ